MDDVIKLISTEWNEDKYGNQIAEVTVRRVFCDVESVGRSEFYQAAQADIHPEYLFILSHYKDYRGEKFINYTDWMGKTHSLYVTRAYRVPGTTRVELTAEERTGKIDGEDDEHCCRGCEHS